MKLKNNLKDIQRDLLNGEYTVVDLLHAYLENTTQSQEHNAFVEVFEKEAMEKAILLDEKIKDKDSQLGELFGAIISIKDNLCYEGHLVTASSKMLDGFISPYSSTVVDRLVKAGAIIIGRTNCDEFSMGSTSETSFYGPVKNAIDKDRIAGGSTGGGAVAVKLQSCLLSIGSDTGGSVRQPGAFNGVYAFKPSYGVLSRWGLISYGSSFDQVGIIANNIEDIQTVMNVISGPDEFDSTSHPKRIAFKSEQTLLELKGKKAFYLTEMLNHSKLDSNVKKTFSDFVDILAKKGLEVKEESFPYTEFLIPAYYILCSAEASSNLSRYDGIRYGHRAEGQFEDYKELIKQSRTEGFGKEVKKRIILGNYVLSEGYFDAYFKKAQKVRRLIKEFISDLFQQYDILILPTVTSEAWELGKSNLDPIEMYLSDMFTVLANLCGLPSLNIPLRNKGTELPLGIQVMSKEYSDDFLLTLSNQV